MISIIVSSYQKDFFEAFTKSVANTIGDVPYELIQICNPALMGICAAYNKGARQAKYDYLCFVHEDVLFKTENWGVLVINHLKDKSTGAIGVAGSAYKSVIPSTWSIFKKFNAINIIQHSGKNDDDSKIISYPNGIFKYRVVALDGVFIATRKNIWEKYLFDEKLFKDFHGYDIDFSLNVSRQYNLYVVFDILIEHFSKGKPNRNWFNAAMDVSRKWKHILPTSCLKINQEEEVTLRKMASKSFENKLRALKYNWLQSKYYKFKYGIHK